MRSIGFTFALPFVLHQHTLQTLILVWRLLSCEAVSIRIETGAVNFNSIGRLRLQTKFISKLIEINCHHSVSAREFNYPSIHPRATSEHHMLESLLPQNIDISIANEYVTSQVWCSRNKIKIRIIIVFFSNLLNSEN